MNGKRYFLDTNAIVQLLAGNQEVLHILSGAEYVATSVICVLEFLAFPDLDEHDKKLFQTFIAQLDVYDLMIRDKPLTEKVLDLRRSRALKLPDAIIAASAKLTNSRLLTADKKLLGLADIDAMQYTVLADC